MTTLEAKAHAHWVGWGPYAKHTCCSGCDEMRYCRARRLDRWLCVDCFDLLVST